MDYTIEHVLTSGSYLLLAGLVAAALFFAMAGLRELQSRVLEGLLYLFLSLFLVTVHACLLANLPPDGRLGLMIARMNLWTWLTLLYAPGLIALFLVRSVVSFFTEQYRPGLVKLYFGLTLICFLYMVGSSWPVDMKAILALLYGLVWFNVELCPPPSFTAVIWPGIPRQAPDSSPPRD